MRTWTYSRLPECARFYPETGLWEVEIATASFTWTYNALTGQVKACLVPLGPSVELRLETNSRASTEAVENKLPKRGAPGRFELPTFCLEDSRILCATRQGMGRIEG